MLSIGDISEYVRLCRMIGADFQLIQGTGGNISIKSEKELMIKSSGKRLAETTADSGYVRCSYESTNVTWENGTPSMELLFHLLPFKYIVHVHPLFLLPALCSADWNKLSLGKFACAHIDYKTPGSELGMYILEHSQQAHTPPSVYFLQNHGVILCSNSMNDLFQMIDQLYKEYDRDASALLALSNTLHETATPFFKRCEHVQSFYERLFLPFTPDIHLFLKEEPLFQELPSESIQDLFTKYIHKHGQPPTVARTTAGIFVVGKSYHHCQLIEEMLESYIQLLKHTTATTLTLNHHHTLALQASEQEKHRLRIV